MSVAQVLRVVMLPTVNPWAAIGDEKLGSALRATSYRSAPLVGVQCSAGTARSVTPEAGETARGARTAFVADDAAALATSAIPVTIASNRVT
jgi:hypothetical protein